ncbi:hypothetical protein M758_8G113700 [Ceratodon purpureus]|nr:hypothetical protein M758_8G113700 [Ceratodon purpureus]
MEMAMAAAATIPVVHAGPSASSRLQCGVRLQRIGFPGGGSLGGHLRGEGRSAESCRSRPWRGACRALKPNSDEIATPPPAFVADQPQVFYFAVANAQSLMLEGAPLESVLQDGIERAERAKSSRDVWLIMEPAFLNQHPGLKALNAQLSKPTAAILSTNADWMLSFVKKSLPQAVIGKFVSPSTAVPDPLKSNLNANSDVVGGGGVWH